MSIEGGRWIQWVDSVGAKGAWQGHTLERKTLPKMRSKCAGVLRDWALVSLSLCIYVYIYVYVWRLQGCVAALVLCFIFSLFYFIFCWRTHTDSSSVCLFVCPYPAADESTFAFYSSHETQTEKRTEIKRSRITFAWNPETIEQTHTCTPGRKSRKQDTDTEIRLRTPPFHHRSPEGPLIKRDSTTGQRVVWAMSVAHPLSPNWPVLLATC